MKPEKGRQSHGEAAVSPCVSVVLPVYNNGAELNRCMEALRAQTFPAEKTEILLVDDGSADGTALLCDEWAARLSHVRVIHQRNAGASAARNTGFREARGTWVAFVDPDDEPVADYLRAPLAAGEQEEADVVLFDGERVTAETGAVRPFVYADASRLIAEPAELLSLRCRTLYEKTPADGFPYPMAAPWNKLYRRSFLVENDLLFPQELKVLDDMAFLFRVFARARRVAYLHRRLYRYFYHAGTVSTKYRADRAQLDLAVYRYLSDDLTAEERAGRTGMRERKKLKRAYCARVVKSFAICCRSSFFHGDNPDGMGERLRAARTALREPMRVEAFRNVRLIDLEWRLIPVALAGRLRAAGVFFLLAALEGMRKKRRLPAGK